MRFNTVFCVTGAVLLNIAGCLGQLDVCGRAPLNTKILEGENATEGSWPWQASINLVSNGEHLCSGSLISKEWVLSAAKCFTGLNASDIVVYLGRLTQHGINPHEKPMRVIQVISHPIDNILTDSIALLQLFSSVTFSDYIKPVCLAAADSVFDNETESWVTGWGFTNNSGTSFSNILKEVEAPIVNNRQCDNLYGGKILYNMICAGIQRGQALCEKDVGAPLVTKEGSQWIQSAVALFGNCGKLDKPSLYARLSEYEDWISNYTSSSLPGFVSYPVIYSIIDGGSVNLLSSPLALTLSIIPFIILHFF